MTLVIGTSPAGVRSARGVATITTASFSPPANALLVAMVTGNMGSAIECVVTSVTNTGTALAVAWSQAAYESLSSGGIGGAVASIWTGVTGATPGAITVKATQTANLSAKVSLFVLSVTDSGGSVPLVGASTLDKSASGIPTASVTTDAGSHLVAAVSDWSASGAGTYTGFTSLYDVTDSDYSSHNWRTTSTVSLGANSISMTAPTTQNYNMVALEVKVPSGAASPSPSPNLTMAPMRRN